MSFQVFVNVFGPLKHQVASNRLFSDIVKLKIFFQITRFNKLLAFPDLITDLTVPKMIESTLQVLVFSLSAIGSKS